MFKLYWTSVNSKNIKYVCAYVCVCVYVSQLLQHVWILEFSNL
jgi:hypothetical protein